MASTTLSQEILRSFDSKVEEAIPTFPEFLQTRFAQYNILQEELDILEETLSRHKIPSDQKDNYK